MAANWGLVGAVVVPPDKLMTSSMPMPFVPFLGESLMVLVTFDSYTEMDNVSSEETIATDTADVIA